MRTVENGMDSAPYSAGAAQLIRSKSITRQFLRSSDGVCLPTVHYAAP